MRVKKTAILAVLAVGGFGVPAPAAAVSSVYAFLDLDANPATGCTVDTVEGPFSGVEELVLTTVEEGWVIRVERRACLDATSDDWDGATPVPAAGGAEAWPVGRGLGLGGADVVETSVPLSASDGARILRLGFATYDGAGGGDALLSQDGLPPGEGNAILISRGTGDPVEIPTLSWPALTLLAVVLAALAWTVLARRRRGTLALLILLALVATAHAAGIELDGLVGDWAGVAELCRDATDDAPAAADLQVAMARIEGERLYLRLDVGRGPALAPGGPRPEGGVAPDSASPEEPLAGGAAPEAEAGPEVTPAAESLAPPPPQDPYEAISPMESTSGSFGSVDEMPGGITYNEYSGYLSLSIPLGVSGLQVSADYNRSGIDQLVHYGLTHRVPPDVLGVNWHLYPGGFVQLRTPRPIVPSNPIDDASPADKIAYVDGSGEVTEFKTDYLFQIVPVSVPFYNKHYIDSSLRRLTWDTEAPGTDFDHYTAGEFVLLEPGGTRTYFKPVWRLPAPTGVPGSEPMNFMRFYPDRIVLPNGRKLTFQYLGDPLGTPLEGGPGTQSVPGGGSGGAGSYGCGVIDDPPPPYPDVRKQLDAITDNDGRRLRFLYHTLPPAGVPACSVPLLREVRLEHGGSSISLGTFTYTTTYTTNPFDEFATLETFTTAGGYVTRFEMTGSPVNPTPLGGVPFRAVGLHRPVITRVDLPTEGSVEFTYESIPEYYCPYGRETTWPYTADVQARSHVRVKNATYGGKTYRFTYTQGGLPEGPGENGEFSVNLDTYSVNIGTPGGDPRYSRTTTYFQAGLNLNPGQNGPWTCDSNAEPPGGPGPGLGHSGKWAGRLKARKQVLFSGGVADSRFEEWNHRRIQLATNNSNHAGHYDSQTWLLLTQRYSDKRSIFPNSPSTITFNTEFEYDIFPDQGNVPVTVGSFNRPARVVRYESNHPGELVEQQFTYENRILQGHSETADVEDYPYVLALEKSARVYYQHSSPADRETMRFQERTYEVGRPLLASATYWAGPGASVTRSYTYHSALNGTTPLAAVGMLHTESSGGVTTTYQNYAFGVARDVVLPLGPHITRTASYDGTVSAEAQNGVTMTYGYDADRRLTLTTYPIGHALEYQYSPFDPNPAINNWRRTKMSTRLLEEETYDSLGRTTRVRRKVDYSLWGDTHTVYDELGLVAETRNERGAPTIPTYDVFGRVTKSETQDADRTDVLRRTTTEYRYDPNGYSRTIEYLEGERSAALQPCTVDATDCVKRVTVRDLAGRIVSAKTNDHMTRIVYGRADPYDANSLIKITTRPRDTDPRVTIVDWLGRKVSEWHPEPSLSLSHINDENTYARYLYDARGRLWQEWGQNGSFGFQYQYDDLDRPTARYAWDFATEDWTQVASFDYDEQYNQLSKAAAFNPDGTQRSTVSVTEFDERGRARKQELSVKEPPATPDELDPDRFWFLGLDLELDWEWIGDMVEFRVEFQRCDQPASGSFDDPLECDDYAPLRFDVNEAPLLLNRAVLLAAVEELDAQDRQAWEEVIGDEEDPFFLSRDSAYRWRVHGFNTIGEPTFWSEWAELRLGIGPDDCHFTHFRVIDGVEEAPLVEWATHNCQNPGFVVRVLATTDEASVDPACHFVDAEFSAEKQGPRRAHFMIQGYDMVNGEPDFPADPANPDCPGPPVAHFKGQATAEDGEVELLLHEVGPETGRVLTGNICNLRMFNIIDGLNNTAPTIRWQTEHCEDWTVEVLRSTFEGDATPECTLIADPWVTGPEGQVQADWMLDGYTAGGTACAPQDRAWFQVRAIHDTTGQESPWTTTPAAAYVETDPDPTATDCHTRLLTSDSAPGIVPLVAWETIGCDPGYEVRLTRSSVGSVPPGCFFRDDLWDSASKKTKYAHFLAAPHTGPDGVTTCDLVAHAASAGRSQVEADFEINLWDPAVAAWVEPQEGDRIRKRVRATYQPAPDGGDDYAPGGCHIDYFNTINGFHGVRPVAAWGTTGCRAAGASVRLKVVTDPILPASCRLDGAVWSDETQGPATLDFMVDGYEPGFIDDGVPGYQCVGDPGGNGTFGQALQRAFVYLETTDANGDLIAVEPPNGPAVVLNHNDQLGANGPDAPCQILEFGFSETTNNSSPLVLWTTDCAAQGRYAVEVRTRALYVSPTACRINETLLSASKNGPKTADFLKYGWHPYDCSQTVCHTASADFRVVIRDTQTNAVIDQRPAGGAWATLTYSGAVVDDPRVPPGFSGICDPDPTGNGDPGAPTVTRPDGNYPSYDLFDTAVMQLTTDPPQPNQRVYTWRNKNGVVERNGDPLKRLDAQGQWVDAFTDGNGALTVVFTIDNPVYCGFYTNERFAVGSPDGPRSAPLSYSINCSTSGQPVVHRNTPPYPFYELGDLAQLVVETFPAQPFAPVYLWRSFNNVVQHNGAPLVYQDGAGNWVQRLTDASGVLIVDFVIDDPGYCGSYSNEMYAVGSPSNPKSLPLNYTIDCPDDPNPPLATRNTRSGPTGPYYCFNDWAQLDLRTNPPQPGAKVYGWRYRDGVLERDGEVLREFVNGQWRDVVLDANGEWVHSWQIDDANLCGSTFTGERFAVGSVGAPRSTALQYQIRCDCP